MKLADLEPKFLKIDDRGSWPQGFVIDTDDPETEKHGLWLLETTFELADGIEFNCPKAGCTHKVICWRPCVDPKYTPGPGRWEFQGTGLGDLSLVAGSSSILLKGGCAAHFFVRNGEITW